MDPRPGATILTIVQTYLLFRGVRLETVSSNNHASPAGALPFLEPSAAMVQKNGGQKSSVLDRAGPSPVPAAKLATWIRENTPSTIEKGESDADASHESSSNPAVTATTALHVKTHFALLDHSVRKAWVGRPFCHPPPALTYARPRFHTQRLLTI
jgi:metaxin